MPVNVQLILLVVVEEAPPCFEDWVMTRIGVVEQVFVLFPRQSRLDFDNLAFAFWTSHGARVRGSSKTTPLA